MPPIIFGSLAYEDFKTNIKFERLFGKNLKDFTSYIWSLPGVKVYFDIAVEDN